MLSMHFRVVNLPRSVGKSGFFYRLLQRRDSGTAINPTTSVEN